MRRRTLFYLILITSILLLAVLALLIYNHFAAPKYTTYAPPLGISSVASSPANNRQNTEKVWLGCYDKQLYYFNREYDGKLFVFQEDALSEVTSLSHNRGSTITIFGIVENYIYYREQNGKDYTNQKLYCYNLQTNENVLLATGNLMNASSIYYSKDGSVYFPLMPESGEQTQYIHVCGQDFLGIQSLTEGYPLGNSVYCVASEYTDRQVERILEKDMQGQVVNEEISFAPAYNRSVIPCESGLLVHNAELNSLLYLIHDNGEITELFHVACLASESAVNIHGTNAYICVKRYKKYGEIGMLRYENDTVEGTYRINLTDGTVEKINDMIFAGIYNFDDTRFYCCDSQGDVYVMEFDGSTSPVLVH